MEEVAVELDFEDCIGKMRIAPGKGKGRKKKKTEQVPLLLKRR